MMSLGGPYQSGDHELQCGCEGTVYRDCWLKMNYILAVLNNFVNVFLEMESCRNITVTHYSCVTFQQYMNTIVILRYVVNWPEFRFNQIILSKFRMNRHLYKYNYLLDITRRFRNIQSTSCVHFCVRLSCSLSHGQLLNLSD